METSVVETSIKPIGYFSSGKKSRFEAARQAEADGSPHLGYVELLPGENFEQALEDLDGFSKIWLIYGFHKNTNWKAKVSPPRSPGHKVGVFASRSPYRPNALGLSCVSLLKRQGLCLTVGAHDLLDGSPIYDIKPYLPYSDSFPEARIGWLEGLEDSPTLNFQVELSPSAQEKLAWLATQGLSELLPTLQQQLSYDPFNSQRKRIRAHQDHWLFAYKTWRVRIHLEPGQKLLLQDIFSGYAQDELLQLEDPYQDKDLHRKFGLLFPGS